MHVISKKKLREFWETWPEAEKPLRAWYRVAEQSTWEKYADVKQTYSRADQVGRCLVFDIAGNKFRLIAIPFYQYGRIYIRHVLTHGEYDRGNWKDECQCR